MNDNDTHGIARAREALSKKISSAHEEARLACERVVAAQELWEQLRDFLREQKVEEPLRLRLNGFMHSRCSALLKTADAASEYAMHLYSLCHYGMPFTMPPPGRVDATQECRDFIAAHCAHFAALGLSDLTQKESKP